MGRMEYVSTETERNKILFVSDNRDCIKCKQKLTDKNWGLWAKKKRHYICKPCINKNVRESKNYLDKRTTTTKKKLFDLKHSRKITNFIKDSFVRGINLELNFEQIGQITLKNCFYCGNESTENKRNGIDRKDSSIGYTLKNSVSCCGQCNTGKGTLTAEEYIQHCKNVLAHNGGI